MIDGKLVSAIIVAAGNSTRMGGEISKQLMSFGGKTVIEHTLAAFTACDCIDEIVVSARVEDFEPIKNAAKSCKKLKTLVRGGATRQQSVQNALDALSPKARLVAIHDGARPLITPEIITETVVAAAQYGAAACGVPVKDTIKLVSDGVIADTPDRSTLWAVQTPQVFEVKAYISAIKALGEAAKALTDDCRALELCGQRVYMTMGSYENIKITTPDDVILADTIYSNRRGEKR